MTDSPLLDSMHSPEDLKALDAEQIAVLAGEIRQVLIETVSETGGHLAPNLGVVELTIGLHRALECPADKVIWDVGHQAYVHKLLTGRREGFGTLRQYGGVCGFPKRSESCFDVWDTGHASNSISVALGMAEARERRGGQEAIVAVIGDGSLTGGMAFEALNHAGHLGTRLVVLLNDNTWSISPNVGALAGYLSRVRLDPRYMRLRDRVEAGLESIPGVGHTMWQAGEAARESVKQWLETMVEQPISGMLFEELGFKYIGPMDGHDVQAVQTAVASAKEVDGPVLIHAVTRKGFGYEPAEENPDAFHGLGPFAIDTGKINGQPSSISYTEVFGQALTAEADRDQRICAVTAAMPSGTGLDVFAAKHAERFFDVGIAEQHAVGLAAGLAADGMLPVVAIYSTFMQRAYDQLIMDVALQDLHVVFCLDRAGLVGEDGPTHHGAFDLTYLRSVPNFMVMAPADEAELVHMLHTALAAEGPVAIRYPRGAGVDIPLPLEPVVLEAGKAETRREGSDVALLAIGRMVSVAEKAAAMLAEGGVEATVVNMRWLKPLDLETVSRTASSHPLLVTIEENTCMGGMGSAVLEALADLGAQVPVLRLALPDCFITHGATSKLLAEVGLTAGGVRDAVLGRLEDLAEKNRPAPEDARRGTPQSRRSSG